MKILVTGSAGLIGSEAVVFYCSQGASVYGIDNNMREVFFGSRGDTSKRNQDLSNVFDTYTPLAMDIRDRDGLFALFQTHTWDLIIHCAAQPSHDLAAKMPLVDFEVNCLSTLNLLEATRLFCPTAVFIFMSTNKVYGDAPNELTLLGCSLRYDFADMSYQSGIFDNDDHLILEIIRGYKNVYEYIIHKSLEYRIDITPNNYISGTSKVSYFTPNVYNSYTYVVDMHIVGYLDGNTFTWNNSQMNTHYQKFRTSIAPYIYNQYTINTLIKLFSYNQITFPEKYRYTIPYLLSYMYDPKKANIIRFSENLYSNHHNTFAFMEMSLDIPNWSQMVLYINSELNNANYYGGADKTNNKNMRLLKDIPLAHISKNYNKLYKSIE